MKSDHVPEEKIPAQLKAAGEIVSNANPQNISSTIGTDL